MGLNKGASSETCCECITESSQEGYCHHDSTCRKEGKIPMQLSSGSHTFLKGEHDSDGDGMFDTHSKIKGEMFLIKVLSTTETDQDTPSLEGDYGHTLFYKKNLGERNEVCDHHHLTLIDDCLSIGGVSM